MGKLLYLTITRPDLSFDAHTLSQCVQNPTNLYMDALIRTLRYIKGALGQGLFFPSNSNSSLLAYCDSDWVDVNFLEDLFLAHVYLWETLSFHGNQRNNLWSPGLLQKLNIEHL